MEPHSTRRAGQARGDFIFRRTDIARQNCMTIGKDRVANDDGVHHVLRILRYRIAPDAIDAMF